MLPNISTATVHRQGTGHKRCPAHARRANVPPLSVLINRHPIELLAGRLFFRRRLSPGMTSCILSHGRSCWFLGHEVNIAKLTAAVSGVKLNEVISVPRASVSPYRRASRYFCGSAEWNDTPRVSWYALTMCAGLHAPPSGPHPATPAMSTSVRCWWGTMRAIQGVCNRFDHAFDFTTGLSSRRRVQSQAPSLTMVLIARQKSPPTRTEIIKGWEGAGRGGGASGAGQGRG